LSEWSSFVLSNMAVYAIEPRRLLRAQMGGVDEQ
jgi:hypothetical protein